MNFEYFIAKRIIDNKAYKSSISAPIIKIGIVAIALGIIVMLITIATGIGLQQKIRDKVVSFNGHATITNYDTNNSLESENPISINQEFYPDFKSVDGVTHVQGIATKYAILRQLETVESVVVKGVGKDYDWQYLEEYLIDGALPNYTSKLSQELLISEYFAKRLNLKIGDKVNAYFLNKELTKTRVLPYTIIGIYNSGIKEFDQQYAIGDIKHIQRLNKWKPDEIGSFEVFIDDFNTLDQKAKEIFKNTPSTLNTVSVKNKFYLIFEWISIFDLNIFGIIVIMILVAGINMITALLVLILERTQMIGILKALGNSDNSIRKIFVYNATYLILVGLFWGNLIGLGFLFLQKKFGFLSFPNPEDYYMTTIPVYISLNYILLLNIGTFILCFIMLLVPSYIITKISPVKAMRFE